MYVRRGVREKNIYVRRGVSKNFPVIPPILFFGIALMEHACKQQHTNLSGSLLSLSSDLHTVLQHSRNVSNDESRFRLNISGAYPRTAEWKIETISSTSSPCPSADIIARSTSTFNSLTPKVKPRKA